MGELAKRRSGRDLWISRSHLWAAGTGALLLVVAAFAAGVLLGGGERAHASASADAITLDGAPDDRLVELLARVESSADPSGGVTRLTFPDVLDGDPGEPAVPEVPEGFSGMADAPPAPDAAPPQADAVPEGEFTVALLRTGDRDRAEALRQQLAARDLPAWIGAERVGGDLQWRVGVGGFPTADGATAALADYRARCDDLPLVVAAEVEPLP